MKLNLFAVLLSTFFLVVALSTTASAISIDCAAIGGECIGGTYDLTVESLGGTSYKATYTIDTSGPFSVPAMYLNDVEFKVAKEYKNALLSGPDGVLMDGPLNGAGCNGNNDSFLCVALDPKLDVGGSYTWMVTFEADGLLEESDWHVGARYTSDRHERGWVISESAPPIPEPTSALLFAAGLLVVGGATQRKRS